MRSYDTGYQAALSNYRFEKTAVSAEMLARAMQNKANRLGLNFQSMPVDLSRDGRAVGGSLHSDFLKMYEKALNAENSDRATAALMPRARELGLDKLSLGDRWTNFSNEVERQWHAQATNPVTENKGKTLFTPGTGILGGLNPTHPFWLGNPIKTYKDFKADRLFKPGGQLSPKSVLLGGTYDPYKGVGGNLNVILSRLGLGLDTYRAIQALRGKDDPEKGRGEAFLGHVGSALASRVLDPVLGPVGTALFGAPIMNAGRSLGEGIGRFLGSKPKHPAASNPYAQYEQAYGNPSPYYYYNY